MRATTYLLGSACAALIALSSAQAGPAFVYNWTHPEDDLALFSDQGNYMLHMAPTTNVSSNGSGNVTAAALSLQSIVPGSNDAFTDKSFKIGVTVQDGGITSDPLFFTVHLTASITPTETTNDLSKLTVSPVTSSSLVVNGDKYTFTDAGFSVPNPSTDESGTALVFHIDQQTKNEQVPPPPPPQAPPTSDAPEPSTLLLVGTGSTIAVFLRWIRRRASGSAEVEERDERVG